MTPSLPFSVHRFPFTVRYLFTVIRDQWLIVNGKCTVNSEWSMANGAGGAS